MICLISHLFHIPHDKVLHRPNSEYAILAEQAVNIFSANRGGKFELMSTREKNADLLDFYKETMKRKAKNPNVR